MITPKSSTLQTLAIIKTDPFHEQSIFSLDEEHFIALFFSDYLEIVSQRQFRIWNHKLRFGISPASHTIRDLAALDQSGNKEVRVFCKDFMDFVEFFFLKLACAAVTRALETEQRYEEL